MNTPAKPVLVVEDDEALRDIVELALTDAGYRVVTAANGRVALDQVAREMPGLILLDMKMPVMNGWEFVSAFRARYAQPVPPIVVVTAAEDAAARAAEVQADAHLDKPFALDDLFALVERYLAPAA